MSADTINETINVCKYLGVERKTKIIEGEVVLPDIKPDILSIVKMKGRVCINQVNPEEDKIIVDGIVCINVIYIADDDTNSQRGINYELPFSETISFPGVTEASIIRFKYDLGSVEYKVMNGRKIAIKVPIVFNVKAFNNSDISIVKGITDDEDMEVRKTNVTVCSPMMIGSTQVELKENVQLNSDNMPIGEILDYDLCITNKEYKLSYNKILAKADAKVKIVYCSDSEEPKVECFETVLPLMGIIDMDGVEDSKKIKIDYILKNFCVKPVYQDLQANAISVEILACVNSYVYDNNEIELITDFYTPNAILKSETQKNQVLKSMVDNDETMEINQTLVVPELDNTRILNISADATLNERNILNGKVAMTGTVDIYVLFAKATNNLIESKKLELPFQQVIKMNNINQNMEPLIHVSVEDIGYSPAGENQLQIDVKLLASVLADEEENIDCISKLEISDETLPNMPSIVVYYVKPGDTLWNIAKRFRNKVEYIKEFNDLKDDTIYPGQRLLIPRLTMNIANSLIM